MNGAIFEQMDFGPLAEFLAEDDVTDISYSNGGQIWLKTLSKGVYQVERPDINDAFMEKLAFQCSNVMGKTFNMAHPLLDAESAELRMNFVHDSIATNGIACLIRKTPAKIRLNKQKLLDENYVIENLHDFLIKCVEGHCNMIVAGETGSGKTELVKYLAAHIKENEKIITIEDTLELHLDKIFPHRDIVAMKTNNIASYSDVLVACMRQNPKWILLSEVRSAEAVMAIRNSISSGHNILSTIHADKASSIPMRMYSLLESSQDTEQFLSTIHRYVQIGIYVKGYFSKVYNRFQREIIEVCEFFVDDDNKPQANLIYKKDLDGHFVLKNPSKRLLDYMSIQNVLLPDDVFGLGDSEELDGDKTTDTRTKSEALKDTQDIVTEPPRQEAKQPTANASATSVQPQAQVQAQTNAQQQPVVTPQASASTSNTQPVNNQVKTPVASQPTLTAPPKPAGVVNPMPTTGATPNVSKTATASVQPTNQNNDGGNGSSTSGSATTATLKPNISLQNPNPMLGSNDDVL